VAVFRNKANFDGACPASGSDYETKPIWELLFLMLKGIFVFAKQSQFRRGASGHWVGCETNPIWELRWCRERRASFCETKPIFDKFLSLFNLRRSSIRCVNMSVTWW